MRVISGSIKGHKLISISGSTVRPTSDRVKEAMFNILASKPQGAHVLDLFAGSGALGIEAVSRGAQSVVFIDSDAQALKMLRQNLKHCKIDQQAKIFEWNIAQNLKCLHNYSHTFDLVFMDPPYHHDLVGTAIGHLLLSHCLSNTALIVTEHEPGHQMPLDQGPLILADARTYGRTQLSFYYYSIRPGK